MSYVCLFLTKAISMQESSPHAHGAKGAKKEESKRCKKEDRKGAGTRILESLRLLFSLKPKEMAKMRLLAIWIDQR